MFSPGELDGEVDHSFFDSDCDDNSTSKDGEEKLKKGVKAEKEGPPAQERLQPKPIENTKVGASRDETKDNSSHLMGEERSRESSISSVTLDKVLNDSRSSEEGSTSLSKKPIGTIMATLAEARNQDHKEYKQSPNESEEEASPSNHSKGYTSPTSSEGSVDADSESSSRSCSGRSSTNSPTLSRPNKAPGVRGTRVSSAESEDVPIFRTEDSEDTVTDVSPLSSPDISPLQSLDLNNTEVEEGGLKVQQQEESVPSSGLSDMHQDGDSDQDVDECSLRSDSKLGGELVFHCPGRRNRKNYSFSNDEAQRIERENHRLLRVISRHSPAPRPGSSARKNTHTASKSPIIRLSHSALNREREQQRIERENLAFLKRLQSAKPTTGLKRSEQLQDFQRQAAYLGAPSYPICTSTNKKERSTSTTPSAAGPRPASSAHHSSGLFPAHLTLVKHPHPGTKRTTAVKPAWS
ncbi:hypothetical protein PBY51_020081 [Eleginops maclovinus]|uniref:Cilia- and flagella-associated protein 97 n=1 Tax=Eleginops maclovinus TaxID=56733 RepID=A0AAN8ASQ6_ELEMC|nr:hypothetical protein PBY51_020081 [Eleginops maclovinus]